MRMSTNTEIYNRGFRRSPHLQAVMDRIEQRKEIDREKEFRWQETSRRRRNRQASNRDGQWAMENEQNLSDVLETFAKYDNMLERLVMKNMEVMNLAEKKSRGTPDDDDALKEKVLNDLQTIRQFRLQQITDKRLHNFSDMEDNYAHSSPKMARNPYLQFRRPNESHENGQTSRERSTQFSSKIRPFVCDEEIVDTFRPPRKTAASTQRSKRPFDNEVSRAERIRELRERQLQRREAQVQNSDDSVDQAKIQQADEFEMWQFEDRKNKANEELIAEHRQQAKAHICRSKNKQDVQQNRDQIETVRNELDELWCMCPVDLPEPHRLPTRNFRKVESKFDPQTDESDDDSFGPSREARKLKKRLSKIYRQNKTLGCAQERMRGEMLQLQQGYKQKHNKLQREFLRNTVPFKQHQNEAHESDIFSTRNLEYGQRDDNISYEVRDGVIVLDDIQDGADIPECEFLGVHNPKYRPELSGGNNYMQMPVANFTGAMHGQMDKFYIHQDYRYQDYMQRPAMELPFSPKVQAQYSDEEWTYDHKDNGEMQFHPHNYHDGRDDDDTDNGESMTCDSQSADTTEHYQERREPVWNCAAEL
ncbi:MAG: hypothetical protein SGBAC_008270 [Bacillariaceae sp.]